MARTPTISQSDSKESLRREWSEYLGRELTPDEFLQLQSGLSAFFNLLKSWDDARPDGERILRETDTDLVGEGGNE
jgi:hypothetical protein